MCNTKKTSSCGNFGYLYTKHVIVSNNLGLQQVSGKCWCHSHYTPRDHIWVICEAKPYKKIPNGVSLSLDSSKQRQKDSCDPTLMFARETLSWHSLGRLELKGFVHVIINKASVETSLLRWIYKRHSCHAILVTPFYLEQFFTWWQKFLIRFVVDDGECDWPVHISIHNNLLGHVAPSSWDPTLSFTLWDVH